MSDFTLLVKTINGDIDVDCDTAAQGLGLNSTYTMSVADLRLLGNKRTLYSLPLSVIGVYRRCDHT